MMDALTLVSPSWQLQITKIVISDFENWNGNAKVIGGQKYFVLGKDHIDLLIVVTD